VEPTNNPFSRLVTRKAWPCAWPLAAGYGGIALGEGLQPPLTLDEQKWLAGIVSAHIKELQNRQIDWVERHAAIEAHKARHQDGEHWASSDRGPGGTLRKPDGPVALVRKAGGGTHRASAGGAARLLPRRSRRGKVPAAQSVGLQ
jgi:hypothetical protein